VIAETVGIECQLIVDSTALPEQCPMTASWSFRVHESAGQRCSRWRLLFLPDEIADQVLEMSAVRWDESHQLA